MVIGKKDEEADIRIAVDVPIPPRWALFVLMALMMLSYLGLQMVIALVVVIWMVITDQSVAPEALASSEMFTWVSLVSGAVGAVATVCLALVWPRLWHWVSSRDNGGIEGWLGWRRPLHLSLWIVPIMTLPFMLLVVLGVTQVFGEAEVDVQLLLFTTPSLRIATSIVVSTIIPLAEELIFRGALYNALLPSKREAVPEWQRQALPLIVTSILFAAVHLLAGFETPAAIVQVTILSFYLGGIRAVTGSVKSSVAGHVTWNLVSALALASNIPL
ncbi:MAG: CPBP family intramembrane metalloprotease [Anaerolineae bacterium]|nr:CPBP family intramembrane metalloprotease [Anaerolineae bacterium]